MKNIIPRACLFLLFGLSHSSLVFAQQDPSILPKPKMNFRSVLPNPLNEQPQYEKNVSPDAYLQNRTAWKSIKNSLPLSIYYSDFRETNHQSKNNFLSSMMIGSANGLPSSINGSPDTYYLNSASQVIGFAMGFLAGGVAGGLLSKKYYNYGVPSPFNDFIHFNRH